MPTTMSFLDAVRRESADRCVGRAAEKEWLAALLHAPRARVGVLLGPSGIGKSTLARWLAVQVHGAGGSVGWISGEQAAANPESFLQQVRVTTGTGRSRALADLGRGSVRDLLVVDSFERLSALSRWLFMDLFTELGANLLVLVVTRERVPAVDRASLAVDAFAELTLAPLDREDAEALLRQAGAPSARCDEIVDFARGHPLALYLAAQRTSADAALGPAQRADVIAELVQAFASGAPSVTHTRALYAASVARTLDERLLSAMLGEDGADVFAWLSRSALVERTGVGLSPHATVRSALFSHLQVRDPEALLDFQCRLVDALVPRVLASDLSTAHDLVLQAAFAQRNRTQAAHYVPADGGPAFSAISLLEAPLGPVRDAVARFEGSEGLRSFDVWLPSSDLASAIVRDDGHVAAFQLAVRVPRDATSEDLTDPLVEASWQSWRERVNARDEGDLHLFRWFMDTERYQEITPAIAHLFTLGPLLTMPRMGEINHVAFVNSPPAVWGVLAPSFQLTWDRERSTVFAGRPYAHVYGSLKAMAGDAWDRSDAVLRTLREFLLRQFGLPSRPLASVPQVDAPSSPQELAKALPAFLAELERPASQSRSSLSELLRSRGIANDPASRRHFVEAGLRSLAAAPRTARAVQVLRATYCSSSTKQIAVASELGVPFGTYRYQLRRAIDALAAELWPRLEELP